MDDFTGKLAVIGLASVLVALPTTLLLLWRFRRSVIRGMRVAGPDAEAVTPSAAVPETDGQQAPGQERSAVARPSVSGAERALVRAVVVYAAGGLALTLAFVAADLVQVGLFSILGGVYSSAHFTVPILFAGWIVLPRGRLRRLFVGVWIAVLALLAVPMMIAQQSLALVIVRYWLVLNGPPAALILLFMLRRVRAAGPLVLTLAGGAVLGVNLLLDAAEGSDAVYGVLATIERAIGGVTNFLVILVVGGFVGAAAVVPALRGVGWLHERKHASDQSLVIDTVFLWFSTAYALQLAVEGRVWILMAPGAFCLYKLTTAVGFRLVARARRDEPRMDVLLLRPFSLGRRSERLFDHLSKVWLRVGALHMIAGPDLVMATVKPSEFLVFLSGHLSRRFIRDDAGLREHLASLDLAPDPDGRFRVNQLFCRDNVWRGAMRGLAAISPAVLMDLRGFTRANQGCVFELGELIRDVPLERVIFAVDASTDRQYLGDIVDDIQRKLPAGSPNGALAGIASRVVSMDDSARAGTDLLRALMEGSTA